MRKAIFTLAMLACALATFAQHTLKTALKLVEGQNSYTLTSGEKPPVLWKFHANENSGAILKVSDYGNLSASFLKSDSTMVYGYYDYSEGAQYFPVRAGQDIYLQLNSFSGATAFKYNASIEWNEAIGHGYSAEDAITLVEGKNYMFEGQNSGTTTAHLTYTATEDGVLELHSTYYISNASYTDGSSTNSISFSNSGSRYTGKVNVEKGKKYDFALSAYGTFMVSAQLTHPTIGSSFDIPFSATLGSNILPAQAGTYWYAYTCDKSGYISIASSNSLTGGTVKIYSGTYSSYSSPVETFTGTLNGNWECASPNTHYLICIDKKTASESDESFSLSFDDYKDGEVESNPIVIGTVPTVATTGTAQHYYYAIDATESATGKFLTVAATNGTTNAGTQVYLYRNGSYSKEQGNSSAHILVESAGRYIIHWQNKENSPISFSISLEEPKAGDTFSYPVDAKTGTNVFDAEGVRFYRYTAKADGKIVIQPSASSVYPSFPKAETGYDTWPYTSKDGKYTVDVSNGTSYTIKFSGVKAGDSFSLEEGTYGPGESENTPIIVESSPYAISGNVDTWLKYVAPKSGIFTMKGNLPYAYNNTIGYKLEGSTYITTITQYKSEGGQYTYFYEGSCSVKKGAAIYMHIVAPNANEGDNIEFSIRDYNKGEDYSNPFIPKAEQEITIPQSNMMPQWVRIDLDKGELNMVADISFSGKIFMNENNVASGTVLESFYSSYDSSTGLNKKTFDIATAGVYFIQISNTYNEGHFTFSGKAIGTGISAGEGGMLLKDAEPLAEGKTEHTFPDYTEGETTPVFYKYTAPDDIAKLIHVESATATKLTWLTPDSVAINADQYIAIDKGATVYLKVVARDRQLSFNTQITDYPQYGRGYAEELPVEMEDNGTYFFDYSADERNTYFRYTATKDGILNIQSSVYCTGNVSENGGAAVALNFPTTGFCFINTKRGTTYDIVLTSKGYRVVTSAFAEQLPGDAYYNAIDAVEGENRVPAKKGTYWYRFENEKVGNLIITSEQSLPEGKVEIYGTEYQASHGSDYISAASETGSFNVKCMTNAKGTFYICVNKAEDTEAEDIFSISIGDYEPGQFEDNPIMITEFPAELYVEGPDWGNNDPKTFYAIDTPADKDYFITLSTEEKLSNPYTYAFVYKQGASGSEETEVRNRAELILEKGSRYIIRFVNKEKRTLKYVIEQRNSEQGDTYSNPLPVSEGENTVTSYGKKYYAYTATVTGKLTLYVSSRDIEVAFPSGPSKYDKDYTYVKDNLTYTIDVEKDKEYIICLDNVRAGDTFEISEREYEQGEDRQNPIEITGTYTLGDKFTDFWLRYTATDEAMLTVSSDLTYNGSQKFVMSKNDENGVNVAVTRKVGTQYVTEYKGRTPVIAGDIVYIHIVLSKTYPGKVVTVETRDVKVGESIDKPLVIEPNTKYTIPIISESMPMWCKLTAKEGSFALSVNNSVNGFWYTSYDNAVNDNKKTVFDATADEDYTFNVDAKDAGEQYLKLVKGVVVQSLTITGDVETGISSIAADNAEIRIAGGSLIINGDNTHVSVMTTGGTRIADEAITGQKQISLPAGIYIVEVNGKCRKIVIY